MVLGGFRWLSAVPSFSNYGLSTAHDSHKLIEGPQSRQREVASDAQKRHCVSTNEASL